MNGYVPGYGDSTANGRDPSGHAPAHASAPAKAESAPPAPAPPPSGATADSRSSAASQGDASARGSVDGHPHAARAGPIVEAVHPSAPGGAASPASAPQPRLARPGRGGRPGPDPRGAAPHPQPGLVPPAHAVPGHVPSRAMNANAQPFAPGIGAQMMGMPPRMPFPPFAPGPPIWGLPPIPMPGVSGALRPALAPLVPTMRPGWPMQPHAGMLPPGERWPGVPCLAPYASACVGRRPRVGLASHPPHVPITHTVFAFDPRRCPSRPFRGNGRPSTRHGPGIPAPPDGHLPIPARPGVAHPAAARARLAPAPRPAAAPNLPRPSNRFMLK